MYGWWRGRRWTSWSLAFELEWMLSHMFDKHWYSCARMPIGRPIIRDSKFTCMLRYLNEQILVQEVNKCKGIIPSGLKKEVERLCKEWGVYGNLNVNYMIGLQLEKRGVTSFHRMYPLTPYMLFWSINWKLWLEQLSKWYWYLLRRHLMMESMIGTEWRVH